MSPLVNFCCWAGPKLSASTYSNKNCDNEINIIKDVKQKSQIYELPYTNVTNELFGRGDAYEILKQRNNVEFISTSFLRGSTFDDCIIVVDEVQNMSDQELHTVMTRVGEDCRIIFAGDVKQDDLTSERKKELSGLKKFMEVIRNMREFDFVEFLANDIVRSNLVKSYIIERSVPVTEVSRGQPQFADKLKLLSGY